MTPKVKDVNMRMPSLVIFCLAIASSAAQELPKYQKSEMLDCALHRKAKWVDSSLYVDGKVRFSTLMESSAKEKNSAILYVAFWNPLRTEGKLIQFHVTKTIRKKTAFAIVNDGWVWDNKGQPDVRDTMGGIYTYQEIKNRLVKLKQRPITVVEVDQLKTSGAVCSSPLDYFVPKSVKNPGK